MKIGRKGWKRHAAIVAKRKAAKPTTDSTPDKPNGHPWECDCDSCLCRTCGDLRSRCTGD